MPHANLLYNTIASIYSKQTWKTLATIPVDLKIVEIFKSRIMLSLSNKMYFQNQRFDLFGIDTNVIEKHLATKYYNCKK